MSEIKIDLKHDLAKIQKKLNAVSRNKWPGIITKATNETGFYLVNKFKKEMPRYIDRPKPFTTNALFVSKARVQGDKVDATVEFRDRGGKANFPGHYLIPQVEGGSRPFKRFERALQIMKLMPQGFYAVPSTFVKLDAYGGVPGGYITRLLSNLRAFGEVGYTMNRNPKGKRTRNKAVSYLSVYGGYAYSGDNVHKTSLAPGLYEKHVRESKVYQVFHYVRTVLYKKRFPWQEIGEQAAREKFPEKLDEAIARAVK